MPAERRQPENAASAQFPLGALFGHARTLAGALWLDSSRCSSLDRGKSTRTGSLRTQAQWQSERNFRSLVGFRARSMRSVSIQRCAWHRLAGSGDASLAILASVGEIDPLGTRRDGLAAFLDQKVEEGYVIETRTDTHAIISRRPTGLKRFTSGADPGRYVVEVDEDGIATMRPAEPRRT